MRARLASLLALALLAAGPLLPAAADGGGFVRAYPYSVGPFTLPADEDHHDEVLALAGVGDPAHEAGVIEWWYNVLHVQAEDGHRFGIMASWLWYGEVGHVVREVIFDVTDVDGQAFWPSDRFTTQPDLEDGEERLDIAVETSTLRQTDGAPFEYDLDAAGPDAHALLHLVAVEAPFAPHGGSLPMGPLRTPATQSWYYALPSLAVAGQLTVRGVTYDVRGTGAMDHEWYPVCSCTPRNDWDYFNLQLDDGPDVVAYDFFDTNLLQTLRSDVRLPDGSVLADDAFTFTPLGTWQRAPLGLDPQDPLGPATSKLYSHGWRFDFAAADLHLTVLPLVEDQETFRGAIVPDKFYEGESSVHGTWRGQPVHGLGFAEVWHDSRTDAPAP
ncbi:MAG: carotenoid 1,2-hydratase [Halobacteriales archaeon]|nr:carotenoid 1,2-hydratase [Halobacteriales archaeon]